jgi:hypothetical protein
MTPAANPGPGSTTMGLPYPPPALLKLPQSSLAMVSELGQRMARLWQGGLRSPGLKAEISAPDFSEPGLYLVGRPRSRNPIIFQYPQTREIPKTAGEKLWLQVESMLPQDILPLMVANAQELLKEPPPGVLVNLNESLSKWTQSQIDKNPAVMAGLYAETFSFYEPGRKPLSISRRNFWQALESESVAAGEVSLAISDPLIMLDPLDHNRAWAIFNLKYDSKIRHQTGLRTLILEKDSSSRAWLITAELWLKEDSLKN